MSDPTGFVEMAEQLAAAEAEIERLTGELGDVDDCPDLEEHATLKLVREELTEANAKIEALETAANGDVRASVRELLAALDDRMEAKKFGHCGASHQYRVEQAFRVVRELVEVEPATRANTASVGSATAAMVDATAPSAEVVAKPTGRKKRAEAVQ